MCFVGFSSEKEKVIEDFGKKKQAIALSNCCIKNSKYSNALELIIGGSTSITKSHLDFEVDIPDNSDIIVDSDSIEISLDKLQDQPPYQKVSMKAKVVSVKDPITLEDGRIVQNIISDATGIAQVSLWQEHVNSVAIGKYFINFLVKKQLDGANGIFTPKQQNANISSIDDITDCQPYLEEVKVNTRILQHAKIIAVTGFSSIYACVSCHKGHVTAIEGLQGLGTCSSCPTTVFMENCPLQVSAILSVKCDTFTFKLAASTEHF